jgi:proteasome lid subunit RPN8/RPN11
LTVETLRLPRNIYDEIIAHAVEAYPEGSLGEEVCGILAGKDGRAEVLYRATNVAENRNVRYEVSPHDLLRIFNDMDAKGLQLVAIYHSHPRTEAYPSPTDRQLAFYPEAYYVIVTLRDRTKPRLRAFRIVEGNVREVPVAVEG